MEEKELREVEEEKEEEHEEEEEDEDGLHNDKVQNEEQV